MATKYEDQEGGYVAVRSPEQMSKMQAEIGEVPEEVDKQIELLRSWALAQPHFRGRTERRSLLNALRWAKYKQDKAREIVEVAARFYSSPAMKGLVLQSNEGFSESMREVLEAGIYTMLPKRTKEGCRVFLTRIGKWDTKKHKFEDVFKIAMLVDEVAKMDDTMLLEGKVQINDFKDIGARHVASLPISKLRVITSFRKAAFEDRVKATHVVNASTVANGFMETVKLLQSEKLQQRTHVHWRGVESLAEQVEKEVLPDEYGGTAGPIDDINQKSNIFILSHLDRIQNIRAPPGVFYDESKKLPTSGMFGTHGTYRKISH